MKEPKQQPAAPNDDEHPLERAVESASDVEPDPRVETAQELSPVIPKSGERGKGDESDGRRADGGELRGQGLGWSGLVLSILAFFIYPVFLGIAGAIFGYFSYRQGAQTLGIWSMALGGLAVLGALLFSPYFAG